MYAPRKSGFAVVADSKLELAIAKAPAEVDLPAKLIAPGDVKVVSGGVANWRRDVRLVIPPGSPISQRMIVGETLSPPGNWSGIPPHKHDEITLTENFLKEALDLMGLEGGPARAPVGPLSPEQRERLPFCAR